MTENSLITIPFHIFSMLQYYVSNWIFRKNFIDHFLNQKIVKGFGNKIGWNELCLDYYNFPGLSEEYWLIERKDSKKTPVNKRSKYHINLLNEYQSLLLLVGTSKDVFWYIEWVSEKFIRSVSIKFSFRVINSFICF